jgi:hypothetical protein
MRSTEAWNDRRWPDDARGRYEVWYMTWNDAAGRGYWLRYITENPHDGESRAELWFARFDPANADRTFGIHRHFDRATAGSAPFELSIAGATLRHDGARGELAGGGHDIRWDLRWEPAARELRMLPDIMYRRGGIAETTVVTPNPRVLASGTLVIDGERVELDRVALGQTHLWGKKHAFSWTWGRCAEFDAAPDALLEIIGVRLQRRGLTLPPLVLVTLDLDGERHRLNQFRHVAWNRGSWRDQRVTFRGRGADVAIEGELTCTADQMVLAPYLDPDGTEVFCSNTEIGDARVEVSRRSGLRWRHDRTLVGEGRAHFELGGREPDRAVTRPHRLVP